MSSAVRQSRTVTFTNTTTLAAAISVAATPQVPAKGNTLNLIIYTHATSVVTNMSALGWTLVANTASTPIGLWYTKTAGTAEPTTVSIQFNAQADFGTYYFEERTGLMTNTLALDRFATAVSTTNASTRLTGLTPQTRQTTECVMVAMGLDSGGAGLTSWADSGTGLTILATLAGPTGAIPLYVAAQDVSKLGKYQAQAGLSASSVISGVGMIATFKLALSRVGKRAIMNPGTIRRGTV
jgi:hypothetical protein